jgi:AcrR family transcriptional regulator
MVTEAPERRSARDRLLAAAGELFYEQGVHTVGIDRVIERAGVAKASLYNTFGSKEELVRAYLQSRHEATRERITAGLADYSGPRERLIGIFEIQSAAVAAADYRGCPFVSASAESSPDGCVRPQSDAPRAWRRELFTDLAEQAAIPNPQALARKLTLLYDGTMIAAWMDRDPAAGETAVSIATTLVDAALAPRPAAQRPAAQRPAAQRPAAQRSAG